MAVDSGTFQGRTHKKSHPHFDKKQTHTQAPHRHHSFSIFVFVFFQTAHVCRGKRQDANLNRKTKIHFQDKVIALYQAGSRTTRVINT